MIANLTVTMGNAKTGPIPTTSRPFTTCPSTCALLPVRLGGNGVCYADGRIQAGVAKRATDWSDAQLDAKLADAPRSARYLRDRVVGDVVADDGSFDVDYVQSIADAAKRADLIPFGYSHAWRLASPADLVTVAEAGYVLNASCDSIQDVHDAVALGLPVVIASDVLTEGEMIAGKRVVTCPAQTRDDVTCASCGLCAKPNRAALVRFTLHGLGAKRAKQTGRVPTVITVNGKVER